MSKLPSHDWSRLPTTHLLFTLTPCYFSTATRTYWQYRTVKHDESIITTGTQRSRSHWLTDTNVNWIKDEKCPVYSRTMLLMADVDVD